MSSVDDETLFSTEPVPTDMTSVLPTVDNSSLSSEQTPTMSNIFLSSEPNPTTAVPDSSNLLLKPEIVSIKQYPFVVAIYENNVFAQIGTILSKYYVLTHKFAVIAGGKIREKVSVRAGATRLYKKTKIYRAISVWILREDNCSELAILRVNKPFVFNNDTQPVILADPDDNFSLESPGTIINWPWAWPDNVRKASKDHRLRISHIQSVNKHCEKYYSPAEIKRCHFDCIPHLQGSEIAAPGAPYMIDGKQAAYVVWSSENKKRPNAIEWISSRRKFIDKVISSG